MNIGVVYAQRRDWPKWEWVTRALIGIGHRVQAVHRPDELPAVDRWADITLFEHRDCGIGWRHVRDYQLQKRSLWAQWWWDLVANDNSKPLADHEMFRLFSPSMRLFDKVFVKERNRVGEYREHNIHAEYMDQGCPSWWKQVESPDSPPFDVVVFGTASSAYRERMTAARLLAECGFTVAWATKETPPNGVAPLPWCHPTALVKLMSQAKCVLCIDRVQDVEGYRSDRYWLVAGAGALPVGSDGAVASVCRLSELTAEQRAVQGGQLRQRVMTENTYEHRLADIIQIVAGDSVGENAQDLPCVQGTQVCEKTRP